MIEFCESIERHCSKSLEVKTNQQVTKTIKLIHTTSKLMTFIPLKNAAQVILSRCQNTHLFARVKIENDLRFRNRHLAGKLLP